ncbi:MAG TPA: methyl-accepting chemotaxis protein [Gallionella sp.]
MLRLQNLTIKLRLAIAIAAMSFLLLIIGGIGLYGMGKAKDEMLVMYRNSVNTAQQLSQIQRLLFRSRMSIADSLANPSQGGIEKSTSEVERNIAEINGIWETYLANEFLSRLDIHLTDNFSKSRKLFEDDVLIPAVAALRANNLALADQILWEKVDMLYKAVDADLQALMQMQTDDGRQTYIDSVSRYETTRNIDIAIILTGVALSLWLGVTMFLAITRPLEQALNLASAVAQGDLTRDIEVTTRDELGQLLQVLKEMNENLAGIVGGVRSSSEVIVASTREIAAGNHDLSFRTEEQATHLEEISSNMQELTSTVRQNAKYAEQANQLAANASSVAIRGGQVVGDVVNTMASISDSSRKIVDIIGVIEGIAFQTNILALNAAVEAARAGEQGRGFAVVAGEVRNLAQRSAAAAKEIKGLIDDSVNKVGAGSMQVDQAGTTMAEIVQAVKRVTDIMAEIAAASGEQSAGIEQVNQAIAQMDATTQQNAALVEEAAAATQSMRTQADNLTSAVGIFKLGTAHEQTPAVAKQALASQAYKRPSGKPEKKISQIRQVALVNDERKVVRLKARKIRGYEEGESLEHRA